ncbi:hypothetical protein N0V83_005274 [Neocucurbitaria cava]|uniref:Uncharacterized protein n=1 Tax=Neocucurbitaria cava TaxID=798079 RepID=A0A9W9CM14_9PLEO|nr:hypothetical protein N0V83_005274 [Neocucurbitaria cava]
MHWRHIKIRSPLKQRTQTFRETLLAKGAEEKKAAEQEEKKVEGERRKSLARLEGREGLWPRLKRLWRKKAPFRSWGRLSAGGENAVGQAAEEDGGEEATEEVEVEWEGNWEGVLDDDDDEDQE